jgi:hypothetical protein
MDAISTQAGKANSRAGRGMRWLGPNAIAASLAMAAAAAAIQSFWIPLDADVSWLITAAEKIVSGARLYVDVFEVNPPASVWLYVPFVWIATVIGAKIEAVVAAGFIAGGLASVAASVRMATRLDNPPRPAVLAGGLSFLCLVLPMALFAEREHAALLLAFPLLTAVALIAEAKPLSPRESFLSGVAAGLIIIIKPYFVLAVVAPALWAAWRRRSIAAIVAPTLAGAAAIAIYAAAMLVFTRPYFDWLPLIAQTYAKMHNVWWKVFVGPTVFPAIALALAILARPPKIPPLATAWGIGSAGFVISAIAQAKNYPNHWLPGTALAMAATFVLLSSPGIANVRRYSVGAGLAVLALLAIRQWTILPDPVLQAAVERVAPPSPRILSLSPQLTTGFPVTRNVGGTWVGSSPGLFTAAGSRFVGLNDPLALKGYREDLESFARDVRRGSPDIVLVDKAAKPWLLKEPVIVRAMADYRPALATEQTEIWVRR